MRRSKYCKYPVVEVPGGAGQCVTSWDAITLRLANVIKQRAARRTLLVVECYPGVQEKVVAEELQRRLKPVQTVLVADALLPADRVDRLVAPFLGGEDPVFGFLSGLVLPDFFEPNRIQRLRANVHAFKDGVILIVGCGARLVADGDMLVYADLARWEAQNRFRRNEASNLGVNNSSAKSALQYKRAFFVDWRVADRWKRPLISKWDFVLDTNDPKHPKLADGEAVRRGLRHAVTRPFRLVPFFDPAPWGGQWMRTACDLSQDAPNYGFGASGCVPEENSLLLEFGDTRLEIPALNLVFDQPRACSTG
ncbi:MAG: hypothetical protein U1F83_06895 [Verrucomicrobiota bacterium]